MDKLTLEARIMDSNIPKSEAEWWAQKEITDLRARLEKAEKDAELWQFLLREWFREDDKNSWCMSSDAMFAETPEALEKTAREWIEEQKEWKS